MFKKFIFYLAGFGFLVFNLLYGCSLPGQMTVAQHEQSLGSTQERQMTLGIVQKKIHVGMSQADVAQALGSPNIVTKDNSGAETWIYDKIATEASYSNSKQAASGSAGAGLGALGVMGQTLLGGIVGGSYTKSGESEAGANATTQKTLTVVIKFNESGQVKNLSYHVSKF